MEEDDLGTEGHDSNLEINFRGNNIPNWARKGVVEILTFDNDGHAVSPSETVTRWRNYLGMMAKDHTLFGIDVADWRTFRKTKVLDVAWSRIKRTLDWSDLDTRRKSRKIRKIAEDKLHVCWKQFKSKLRRIWWAPNWRTDARFDCGDNRVSNPQWIKLVKQWETPKGQRRAIAGKRNRDKKRMGHTTGSQTFAEVKNKYMTEHEGVEPDRCTLFELTHIRSNGEPVDKESEKAILDMKEKMSTIKEAKRANQLPEIISEIEMAEIYESVLGKEKHGSLRGVGLDKVSDEDLFVDDRGVQLEVQALREQHEENINCIRKESQEREDKLREEINRQAMETSALLQQFQLQLAMVQACCNQPELLSTPSADSLQIPTIMQQCIENFDEEYRPQPPTQ